MLVRWEVALETVEEVEEEEELVPGQGMEVEGLHCTLLHPRNRKSTPSTLECKRSSFERWLFLRRVSL